MVIGASASILHSVTRSNGVVTGLFRDGLGKALLPLARYYYALTIVASGMRVVILVLPWGGFSWWGRLLRDGLLRGALFTQGGFRSVWSRAHARCLSCCITTPFPPFPPSVGRCLWVPFVVTPNPMTSILALPSPKNRPARVFPKKLFGDIAGFVWARHASRFFVSHSLSPPSSFYTPLRAARFVRSDLILSCRHLPSIIGTWCVGYPFPVWTAARLNRMIYLLGCRCDERRRA